MSKAIDLTGHKFGRWTVIGKSSDFCSTRPVWDCVCECGTKRNVLRNHLRSGHSKSCGCLKSEVTSCTNSAQLTPGMKFNRLTVIQRHGSQKTHDKRASSAVWLCKCECGNFTTSTSYKLTSGYKKSCGCAFIDAVTTHGKSSARIYNIWQHMITRCSEKCDPASINHYYGKGIRVCDRWKNFENFLADMGEPKDGMSIDRIDPNGNYEPSNCRWATNKQQSKNKTTNKIVSINGEIMLLTEAIAMLRRTAVPLHEPA